MSAVRPAGVRCDVVRYTIAPARPEAHLFRVACTVERPDAAGQRFALPAWSPGSYLIREYARHIVAIEAWSGKRRVALEKRDKHTWQAEVADGPLRVEYQVYAWDLSVRGAHLDSTHAFFNGPCVFLRVLGQEDAECELDIQAPRGTAYRGWRVATAMARKQAKPFGFGTYRARDYDELIDHPVEMGKFGLGQFRACGVPHAVAITGRHATDMPKLCRDLKVLCEEHIRFFGRPAPMERYLFLVTAVGDGYGGLEHRASTALLCSRNDLPRAGALEQGERYRRFLGLCSHEYFHTWNVKRIRPAAFTPYDLERENYTALLWAFEGITSYYDDLALVRCGLISHAQYLELLARSVTELLRNPGRMRQSVAESSFDAWIKYYRQDENAPNALVSYYGKGSLVALCLDLHIRENTNGRKSLDDVMRALWRRHGKTGVGVEEDGVERVAEEITGLKLKRQFGAWVRSTAPLPLESLLSAHGVLMQLREAESASDKGGKQGGKQGGKIGAKAKEKTRARSPDRAALGVRVRSEGKELVLTHVLEGGAAQRAGLSAGDAIAAVDGLRPGSGGLDDLLDKRRPGERLEVHVFRGDELREFSVTLERASRDTCDLVPAPGRHALRDAWLRHRG